MGKQRNLGNPDISSRSIPFLISDRFSRAAKQPLEFGERHPSWISATNLVRKSTLPARCQ